MSESSPCKYECGDEGCYWCIDARGGEKKPVEPTPCTICGEPTPYIAPGMAPTHLECRNKREACPLTREGAEAIVKEVLLEHVEQVQPCDGYVWCEACGDVHQADPEDGHCECKKQDWRRLYIGAPVEQEPSDA